MFRNFLGGSIKRQIAALAIGPTIILVTIGGISELLLRDDLESISLARSTALKIEMVVEQVRATASEAEKTAILDVVSRTGLEVREVPAAELSRDIDSEHVDDDFRYLVRDNLPATLVTASRAETADGSQREVVLVRLDAERALAFMPAPPPPDAWISDQQVSLVLKFLGLLMPVLLLSLYAARVIATPLLDFARAAETLAPDEGPDRPFGEQGAAEIRTLAKSLNDMRSRVRLMIDDRTRMLRAISHDLRTPLTRLRLRAERSSQPELKAALLKDINALSDMINDTLTYLSKDMAAEKPVHADLPSLLETVCADFSDIGFNVAYSGPERLAYRCKPRSLARAITNLVENSTKFAQTVSVELATLDDGGLRVTVVDDGPGLPASLRRRVLEPFFKVDSARRSADRGGFGLGLSIVDDIVRAHGGTVELVNRQPRGLEARLDFPPEACLGDIAVPEGRDGGLARAG